MLLEEFAGHLKDEAGVQTLAVVRYPFLIFYAIDNTTDEVVIQRMSRTARRNGHNRC